MSAARAEASELGSIPASLTPPTSTTASPTPNPSANLRLLIYLYAYNPSSGSGMTKWLAWSGDGAGNPCVSPDIGELDASGVTPGSYWYL